MSEAKHKCRNSSGVLKETCRRLVTADTMGMAKEGDRTGVDVDGTENEDGDKHGGTPRCTQVRGSP